jgi:hypothetical protein
MIQLRKFLKIEHRIEKMLSSESYEGTILKPIFKNEGQSKTIIEETCDVNNR